MFRNDTIQVIDADNPDYNPNSLAFWDQYNLQSIHHFLRNGVITKLHSPCLPNTPDIKGCLSSLLIRLHKDKSLYHTINEKIATGRPHRTPRFDNECEYYLQLIASITFHLNKMAAASKVASILGDEYTMIDRAEYNWMRILFNFIAAIASRDLDKDKACHHYSQALEMCQYTKLDSEINNELLDGIKFVISNHHEIIKDNRFWEMIYRLNLPNLITAETSSSDIADKAKSIITLLNPLAPKFLQDKLKVNCDSLNWSENDKIEYVMGSR